MTDSLPVGKRLSDAADDLAQGPEQTAQLFDQIGIDAHGFGSPQYDLEDPGQERDRGARL